MATNNPTPTPGPIMDRGASKFADWYGDLEVSAYGHAVRVLMPRGLTQEQADKSARLIAAAPELLAALQDIMDTLEEARIELAKRGYLAKDRQHWDESAMAGSAAIAKAEPQGGR